MSNAATDRWPALSLSRGEFQRWAQARPGRFERIEGVVVAMAPERASHADRKALVWLALRRAVAAAGLTCHVYPDGMTVEVDDSDFEPDAVLRCGPPLSPDAVAVPDPLIVVEVLSPSTRSDDLTRKLAEYLRHPTISHYLVVWAEKRQILHHRRDGELWATRIVTDGVLRFDPPGLAITMAEIYPAAPCAP